MLVFNIPFYRLLPLSALLLVACSALKAPSPPPPNSIDAYPWQEHQHQLNQIQQFQIRGSVAYFSDKKKVYARFFLEQSSPENYDLMLLSPPGQIECDLSVRYGRVYLNNKKVDTEDDPEQVLLKLTGISIPLHHLFRWILGLPTGSDQVVLNPQYRLKELIHQKKEQTWEVYYQQYNTQIAPALPQRLELTLRSPAREDQRIKIKIDDWILQ